jgi:hypothetical protein
MKNCIDCALPTNRRYNAKRCLPCAKKRKIEQIKTYNKTIKGRNSSIKYRQKNPLYEERYLTFLCEKYD